MTELTPRQAHAFCKWKSERPKEESIQLGSTHKLGVSSLHCALRVEMGCQNCVSAPSRTVC